MKIIRSVTAMQKFSRQAVGKGKTIGLVPTMGFLHRGHTS
ncbi:MAG TPA: pantoate--beta-alanine ligase, partial [candidate division Zixibacteria bacterium]|nr:pantoate--beta-alanine ligase [candidate division Zixibacteria bacterium]